MNPKIFQDQLPAIVPRLRALARRLIGNRDDAEDVLQEALLKAHNSLGQFKGDSSLQTWLYAITTRTGLDHLRAAGRWKNQVMVDACDERGRLSMNEKFGDPSITFDVAQHISFCFTCIGRSLDPEAHAALVLREMLQLENAEAAQVLEMTEPRYRHLLSAARGAMQTEYEGLCALVNKKGACYQCTALRELAPEGQKGPPLPPSPLGIAERLAQVKAAGEVPDLDPRLEEYFFSYVRGMQSTRE